MRKKGRRRRKHRRTRQRRFLISVMILIVLGFFVWKIIDSESDFDRQSLAVAGCPESLLDLAERNSETVKFVEGYLDYDSNSVDRDVSREVKKGKIPLFLQWDKRWGYEQYGDDYMAITGCGPTCLSMVYCGLTGNPDMNPYEVAKKAEAESYYVDGIGSSWNIMDEFAEKMGLSVENVSFDEASIKSELAEGNPIICIMGPGDFTVTGHFIVLTGLSRSGKIMINDPNSKKRSRKQWELNDIMPQIRNLWVYRCK